MKIAITADVHLAGKEESPQRHNALKHILEAAGSQGIANVLIAGDLFHKNFQNYSEFDRLCSEFPELSLHIIPGNHDAAISSKSITSKNAIIYTEPAWVEFGSAGCLFIPYKEKATMYEHASGMLGEVQGKNWILVGHGDYYHGLKEVNPLEKGTYMPLSRENVATLRPWKVFLGHIHKPLDRDNVYYCGSPCGLDINETGKRRFLVFDTESGEVESQQIIPDVIYFSENFVLVPSENETDALQEQIKARISAWDIGPEDKNKVVVRVVASGYCMDKTAVLKALESGFSDYSFYYKDEGPIVDGLSTSADPQLGSVARRTMQLIDEAEWNLADGEPDKEKVKIEALKTIYGV